MTAFIFEKQTFFSIQPLNELYYAEPGATPPGVIEIYLVLKGKIMVHGGGSDVSLDANHLYSRLRHKQGEVSLHPDVKGYVIRFSKSMLYSGEQESYCSHFSAFQALVFRGEAIQPGASFLREGEKLCDMMYAEYCYHPGFSLHILGGFLNIFVLHLMRATDCFVPVSGNVSQHMLVRKFNALLEEKFMTKRKVSEYAALLSVTANYLNGTIKQATGQSVGLHIRQRIVLEAVRQAKLKGASLKEVAYSLGFHDNAHFSRYFKKTAGRNFSDIKRHHFNNTLVSFSGGIG
ncbi:helix-turn-helix domain-containing protein [Paraflavitalea pollutisoli]|uniref:helix-turn-helix domain-containing protein n=1 Tax=Paraflavitalea pollutisoli TaxID=3034143 RepID=UPI0023EB271C|nr:helix-turn-helix domain-containing protein [Paraflavitalea sp. H1-2-19X]